MAMTEYWRVSATRYALYSKRYITAAGVIGIIGGYFLFQPNNIPFIGTVSIGLAGILAALVPTFKWKEQSETMSSLSRRWSNLTANCEEYLTLKEYSFIDQVTRDAELIKHDAIGLPFDQEKYNSIHRAYKPRRTNYFGL
ncbi:MAG: hypothetical protein OCC46_09240 [Pseudodesulfovibrio sp.]